MARRAAAPEWPGDADLGWTNLGRVREVVISEIPLISGNSMLWIDLTALFDLKSLGSFFGWCHRRAAARGGRELLIRGLSILDRVRKFCHFQICPCFL